MNRRKFVLATGATVTTTIAGCTGGDSKGNDSNTAETQTKESDTTKDLSDEHAAFETIGFEGTKLAVEIQDDANVGFVRLVDANGEELTRMSFGEGVTQNSFAVTGTVDEDVKFVAVKDGETVDTVSKSFSPNLELLSIQRMITAENGSMNVSTDWSNVNRKPRDGVEGFVQRTHDAHGRYGKIDIIDKHKMVVFEFTNTGNAPIFLKGNPAFTSGTATYVANPEANNGKTAIGPRETKQVPGQNTASLLYTEQYGKFSDRGGKSRLSGEAFDTSKICTGEPRDAAYVYWDDTGKKYEKTVTITMSGRVIRLKTDPDERYYTCENVELEDSE